MSKQQYYISGTGIKVNLLLQEFTHVNLANVYFSPNAFIYLYLDLSPFYFSIYLAHYNKPSVEIISVAIN